MADAPKPRWYRLTPDRLVILLLAVEGMLWVSQRFRWFPFNQHKSWTVLIAVASVVVFLLLMLLWFTTALFFRWRFQYSIRSLLVLTVAVAIPCGWLAEIKRHREAVEEIEKAGGFVDYDYPFLHDPRPPGPEWRRLLLGEDWFTASLYVHVGTSVTDSELEHLKGLIHLQELDLSGTKVSDAGLEHLKSLTQLQGLNLCVTKVGDAGLEYLKGLTQLQRLNLAHSKVNDAGLEYLKGLTQLKELNLSGSEVSDAGLEHLKGLTQLQQLSLNSTEVSDAGLEHLKGLTQLRMLHINDTKVTNAGVAKLKQALPGCRINH